MSVTDPLIKDLKGFVQHFLTLANENVKIVDNDFYFVSFAQTLEKIFNKGIIRQQNTKYFNRTIDPYVWMVSLAKSNAEANLTYSSCVENVRIRKDIQSNDGRFRLLIKYCLARRIVHVPVELLVKTREVHYLYSTDSIIGDEILSEIFLSALKPVSKIPFIFKLTNSSFLDCTWYIPRILDFELVPCKNLGISVSFSQERAVIVDVQPNSVAAEYAGIKIGDVLDKLNGIQIDSSTKGRLGEIMKRNKSKPVSIKIVKAYDTDSNSIFEPIEKLFKELKIDVALVKRQYCDNKIEKTTTSSSSVSGFAVKYLAKMCVGSLGSVRQIQKALKCLKDNRSFDDITTIERFAVNVGLEIGEMGLKLRDKEKAEVVLEHSYMKISACGNIPSMPKLFGYCAGEENCDVADRFCCYIFEASTNEHSETILQSIGQGFHRTHYAV
ncbi:uncharacterized protein LOC132700204 [Cylas formicarius]|uniref:uncharacterized protein LOC132700204 n=1 Tax=Cylas formicarius TaxID=197179 RepID=UPI0029586831|nr:uncharacterized protein LOC132700204 [Cylas formicarius]